MVLTARRESTPEEINADIAELVGPVNREMMSTGAYDGAARFDKQIASWNPPLMSADLSILPDKDIIDGRTQDTFRNDAYVQGGATLHKDSIVGSVFFPNAKPDYETLGFTEEWATEFQREVEAKFMLWAESPQKWVDASRENTFTALIRLAVGVYTFGGELLATAEWLRDNGREFNTAIQMVDCARLSTPPEAVFDPTVRAGIRRNLNGAAQSYFIRTKHPLDYNTTLTTIPYWKEVPAQLKWGRPQVIYIREQMRVDQTRGIADIAAGLKEVAITSKFRDVTLQNAVVNAMYAASIESELPSEAVYAQLGGGNMSSSVGDAISSYAESFLGAVSEYLGTSKHLKIDGVKVPHLFPGTKLNLRPAGSPGGVGQGFEQSLLRYIAALLGVSYEELSRDYTNTNYSSARAAMANTWKFMQSRKKIVADFLATMIFRLWLEEAINKDSLKSFPAKSAGMLYTNGVQNMMFEALSQCDWTGASRGQIDELKETQAAVLRIKFGLSTHEDELARLGKDWRKVYAQLQREEAERQKRGITLQTDNSINAASGTPSDPNQTGDQTGNQNNQNGNQNG